MKWVWLHDESAGSSLNHGRERRLKIAVGTRCQHLQALPESVGRCLYLGFVGSGVRIVGVHKQHNLARRGEDLMQEFQLLGPQNG
jgi:hypothetical protein